MVLLYIPPAQCVHKDTSDTVVFDSLLYGRGQAVLRRMVVHGTAQCF